MDDIPIDVQLHNAVDSLRNRLLCYHEGTHGRSTVNMHVELKKIEQIKTLLEKLPGAPDIYKEMERFQEEDILHSGRRISFVSMDNIKAIFEELGYKKEAEF